MTRFGTKLIANKHSKDKGTGAVSVPIYQTATFHQEDLENPPRHDYARSGNPTREALEDTIALLEGGSRGFAFASGMAATSSVLSLLSAGDELLLGQDVYGGTYRICSSYFQRFGLQTTFVDFTDLANLPKNIKKNTKAIFLETPSNPLLKITDLQGAIRIAKAHNLLVLVDNTFMSPYLQRPLELGADAVIHSATKFIGGHSDVVGGLVAAQGEELAQKIYAIQNSFGAILGPQDSWLLLRGLKTLKVRMDYQQQSAKVLAQWLLDQEGVSQVHYPGLPNHPGRDVHFAQAQGAGAVLSFRVRDGAAARKFLQKIKIPAVAVSLGGVETIVSYPVRMSHASMPREERERLGIGEELIRVSVGLEEIEDLLEDFAQALE